MKKEVTFIHTSDLQLGMKRWFLEEGDAEAQMRFNGDRLAAITELGELAARSGAAFIVVAGDVFEHNALDNKIVVRAMERFNALPVPVYLLAGNHDPLVADSILLRAQSDNVRVFENSTPILAPSHAPDKEAGRNATVELVGAPYLTKQATHDIVAAALEPLEPTDSIRVLVAHGQVSSRSSQPQPDLIDLPTVEQALASSLVDYVAVGDTHSTMSLSSTGKVWFSGAPETTDFHDLSTGGGENDSGNALVVTISKEGKSSTVSVEPHRVGTWTFEALHAHVNGIDDVDGFLETLRAYPDKEHTVIKYALTGTVDLSAMRRLEAGVEAIRPAFAALFERSSMDLSLQPTQQELDDLGLQGFAAEALGELAASAADDHCAQDAVGLLFRLAGQGA